MTRKNSKTAKEIDWDRIFAIQCRSKRGERLSDGELDEIQRAYEEDPDRYSSFSDRVFEATKPFGAR